ncbi:MAG: hypothetical protein QOE68_2637 [Thermoanaerobaculia bacterium]|nr:hypothetical protein [Thermoanaerobaculia bacterium]
MKILRIVTPLVAGLAILIIRSTLVSSDLKGLSPDAYYLIRLLGDPIQFLIVIFAFFGLSAGSALMLYLQTGFRKESAIRRWTNAEPQEISQTGTPSSVPSEQDKFLAGLKRDILVLQSRAVASSDARTKATLTEAERERLLSELMNRIRGDAATDVLREIRADVAMNSLSSLHGDTLTRLRTELEHLSYRGNLNLIIGILTTAIGIALLGYFVIKLPAIDPVKGNPWFYIADFLPRLSLVIVMEVFAYFFLRLYKGGLGEIKFFQNELTNIESRFLALRVAFDTKDTNTLSSVVMKWADTERNLLPKGVTTLELERTKAQGDVIADVLKNTAAIVRAANVPGGADKRKDE